MDFPAHLFREYDIRGRAGSELSPAFAYELGQAEERHKAAWAEYQSALKVQDEFRRRTGACDCCGGPAEREYDGTLYCDECDRALSLEAEQREAEQHADYARTRGV